MTSGNRTHDRCDIQWGEPYGFMLRRVTRYEGSAYEWITTVEVPLYACPACGAIVPKGQTMIHNNFHQAGGISGGAKDGE
jgi:hypothetical protein